MFRRRRASAGLREELQHRIDRCLQRGDASEILTDDTDALAEELLRLGGADSGVVAFKIAVTVSLLRWLRYLALPPAVAEHDRLKAMSLFRAIIRVDPELVPVEVRASVAADWSRPSELDDSRLDEAIVGLREATGSHNHHRFGNLVDLRNAVYARWRRTEASHDLDEAITLQVEILSLTTQDTQRAEGAGLADLLRRRFEHTDNLDDLSAAIAQWRAVLDDIGDDHPDRAGWRSNLGLALNLRAQLTGNAADQAEAISVLQAAVEETPATDPRRAILLDRIAAGQRRQDPVDALVLANDLDDFVELYQGSAALHTPAALAELRSRTAAVYARQERRSLLVYRQRLEFLNRAQQAGPQVAVREMRSRAEYAWRLAAMAFYSTDVPDVERLIVTAYPNLPRLEEASKVARLADAAELDDATWRRAAAIAHELDRDDKTAFVLCTVALATAPPDADRADLLSLAVMLSIRLYEDDPAAAEWTILLCEEMLTGPVPVDIRPVVLSILATGLRTRHDSFHVDADLDRCVEVLTELTGLLPAQDPDRVVAFDDLAEVLVKRFKETERIADINTAVDLYQQVLDGTTAGSPEHAVGSTNLGEALRHRYEVTRLETDIETAISLGQAAVDATPKDNQSYPDMVGNLSLAYRSRFIRTGRPEDSDAAVDLGRAALEAPPPDSRTRARLQANLAESLTTRMGTIAPDEVIAEMAGLAHDTAKNASNERDRINAELSIARMFRPDLDRTADLDTAIDLYRQAVAATPPTDREHAAYLSNLGVLLRARAIRSGREDDSAAAIEVLAASAKVSHPSDPRRANILLNLGLSLRERLDQAPWLDQVREAASAPTAPSHIRLRAAREWAEAAAQAGDFASAADGYTIAVDQLLRLTWHGRDREHQEEQLSARLGLARDAAACAVAAARPELAVKLLEQGRSILWTRVLELRTDLTRLAERAPALYADLDRVRTTLDDPRLTAVDRRIALTQDWERLLDEVRLLDGFADFLRPLPQQKLLATAIDGPVVLVNVSRWRCDALIVRPDGVTSTSLPDLTAQSAADYTNDYLRALQAAEHAADAHEAARTRARSTGTMADRQAAQQAERALWKGRAAAETALTDALEWLWDTVSQPVLLALGCEDTPAPGEPWPRLWWCPTGPLTLLPLHAAGYHGDPLRTVIDRVVSSYTPTLRALSDARGSLDRVTPGDERLLVVAVAEAPGQHPLEGVADELAILDTLFPADRSTVLSGSSATRDAVRRELAHHRWAHFSCHGDQTLDDPTHGGLALYDAVLTIADVSEHRYHADFAGLSACKTATGGMELADEAITLAAALHYSGCRHVIGALWSVYDSTGTTGLFEAVYREMVGDGSFDPDRSAPALHRAIRALRDDNRSRPTVWTPFTHIGP